MVEINHKQNRALRPHGALTFFIPLLLLLLVWGSSKFIFSSLVSASHWIWVISLAFMGMAHGSLDLHIQQWSRNGEFRAKGWNRFFWYIFLMLVTSALFFLFPLLTTLGFLILTAVHFGEADRVHAIECFGKSTGIPKSWSWIRGALVVAIPSILYSQQTWQPFYFLSDQQFNPRIDLVVSAFGYTLLATTLIIAIIGSIGRDIRWTSFGVTAFLFESVVCFIWFVNIPPMLAIGGYFLALHSTKHMIRLSHLKQQIFKNSSTIKNILRLHIDALWLGIPAYIVVIFWSFFVNASLVYSLAFASIGFYLISTFPHHILVAKIPIREFNDDHSESELNHSIQKVSSIFPSFGMRSSNNSIYTQTSTDGVSSSSQLE